MSHLVKNNNMSIYTDYMGSQCRQCKVELRYITSAAGDYYKCDNCNDIIIGKPQNKKQSIY
jgi:hypothetical protein